MKKNSDYYIIFSGAKIDKLHGNRVGVGILFGIIGIIFAKYLSISSELLNYFVVASFVIVGYFVVGCTIFKKKKDKEIGFRDALK